MIALKFNSTYFFIFIFLFVTEVLIERCAHDTIIRPFVGDFLVVILIYCFVKSFTQSPPYPTALAVLLFSWFIEWMQYFQWVDLLGLSHFNFAQVVMGNYFSWIDLLMYTSGVALIIVLERQKAHTLSNKATLQQHHEKLLK